MDPLFLIDIAGAIRLVFSLNDEIIIHYMTFLLCPSDQWLGWPSHTRI